MSTEDSATSENAAHIRLKVPALTVKDLISVISIAVTLTLAWGVFSTRISVLESTAIQAKIERERNLALIENLAGRVVALERTSDRHAVMLDNISTHPSH